MTDNGQNEPERGQETPSFEERSPQGTIFDRKKLLEITASLIEETHGRISGDRFRPRDGDRERLAYLRTLKELISLHADLLKASHAPPFSGLPAAPAEEDLELAEARKREHQNLERMMYGLPPLPDPDRAPASGKPGKSRAKAR